MKQAHEHRRKVVDGSVVCSQCNTVVVRNISDNELVKDARDWVCAPVVAQSRVFCSKRHAWEWWALRIAKRYAPLLAAALAAKGVKAYHGREWDGACDYKDPEFWYFNPRGWQVGAHVEYDEGTYDDGTLQPETLRYAVKEIEKLPNNPTIDAVWKAFGRAKDKWIRRALRGLVVSSELHTVHQLLEKHPVKELRDVHADIVVSRRDLVELGDILFIIVRMRM